MAKIKRVVDTHTVCETEAVVGVQPAMVSVASRGGPVSRDLGVMECFGHGGFDAVEHGLYCVF